MQLCQPVYAVIKTQTPTVVPNRLFSNYRLPACRLWPRLQHPLLTSKRNSGACVALLDENPSALSNLASKVDLGGRLINIFWDYDNLCPAGGVGAAVVMATRVRNAVLPLGGQITKFRAYGNSLTLSKHVTSIELLSAVGVETVRVSNRKEAADLAIASDMYHFAREVGPQGCIMLVSSDHGFSQLLRYCRSLGCYTITLGVHDLRKRYLSPPLERQVLPNSGNVTLCWSNSPGLPPNEGEKAVLRDVWKSAGIGKERRLPKSVGSIIAVWLNEQHMTPRNK